ncbi:MAG: hypothetical protein OQK82_07930 [Candidatus Pacearchaeota archaeon]|nr:hypothetical protein [Candidatus Pacearchaeota archaeon]
MKNKITLKLKYVILIAIGVLIASLLIASFISIRFTLSNNVRIIGDNFEFIGEKGKAIQYRYNPDYPPSNNSSINVQYDGKVLTCILTKLENSKDYGLVCESENK